MVQYVYDAWGNHTVSGSNIELGNKNPFRYRSYFYDTETGLYFLKARYYDPAIGRFINRDSVAYADPENLNGLNLYAYCLNNPVNYCDPTGHSIILAIIIGAAIGAIVGGTLSGISAAQSGASGWGIFGAVLGGMVVGAVIGGIAGATIYGGVALIDIGYGAAMGGAMALASGGVAGGSAVLVGIGQMAIGGVMVGTGILGGATAIYLFAQTSKSNGYYGERWPGDPHKPDHIHLRGNGIDIRIGRDGNPLPGEDPLNAQARKALRKLWSEFVKLFNRW